MNKKLEMIQKTGVQYFFDYTNLDYNSKGFGLTVDNTSQMERASIAATGYTLSSYVIADIHNYLEREELLKRVIGTLKTLYYNVDHYEGFFVHFAYMDTGKKHGRSEYSTIDTALAINGILVCEQHFQDPEVSKYAKLIIERVNWQHFLHLRNGKQTLHMAYQDDAKGDYAEGNSGFIHHWGMFAEQLMMYLMLAADDSISQELSLEVYHSFERVLGKYNDLEFYYSPGNTLFIYQFPLSWLDLKNITDDQGVNWFNNARLNILAQYEWATKDQREFKTYGKYYYGATASDSPTGYRVNQALPNINNEVLVDGTVAPFAIVGSLPFTPEIALPAIDELFKDEKLWHEKYGFVDAFNYENGIWVSNRFISIDKGTELLMVNAYLYQDIYKVYMNHPLIQKGMAKLKWQKNGGKKV